MSGNRTRGVCVTGRNVTNYTNTDATSSLTAAYQPMLCDCPRNLDFVFGGPVRMASTKNGAVSGFEQILHIGLMLII